LSLEVATASSLVEKAARDINDSDLDPAVVTVFSSICDAMCGICRVQDKIVTANLKNVAEPAPPPSFTGSGAGNGLSESNLEKS
jgi:hypothetical protein